MSETSAKHRNHESSDTARRASSNRPPAAFGPAVRLEVPLDRHHMGKLAKGRFGLSGATGYLHRRTAL